LNILDVFSKNTEVATYTKNSFTGSLVVPCGRTDRHDEANSHLSQICERV